MTNEEFIKSISFEGEIWKEVDGFNGIYLISTFGRVCSCHHYMKNPYKIRTPHKDKLGYFKLSLYKDSKHYPRWIHRLVATAFIPNPYNLNEVDHIDGNPSNNIVTNLRWVTHRENLMNPITRNRRKSLKGVPNVKLYKPVALILQNKSKIVVFESAKSTQTQGFNPNIVAQVCNGVKKTHKGQKFMWLSDYEKSINKSKNE